METVIKQKEFYDLKIEDNGSVKLIHYNNISVPVEKENIPALCKALMPENKAEKRTSDDQLFNILKELEAGKISSATAERQILKLVLFPTITL